ncbi:hypothetical protein PMIN03_010948 [Paraphaeosphaeria minitans]|uniref:Glucoamylase n=1 Tax=Paraphaeosphaeria minitans TaxID=565426 RepID=A0A9P6GLM4_9PLEO|nr:glycosyl hydrolase family 15 [Paraphaeosphaeria minitans]
MLFTSAIWALPASLLFASAHGTPLEPRQISVDAFITSQRSVSIQGVLANIGADGSKAQGAAAGIVVASPSKSNPDYWYTWTRDSALTYKALVERFISGDTTLRKKLDEYVSSQAYLQTVSNPSGGPDTGGLGEPKFNVDRTAFTGAWGRPQRDGPPLRATALTLYANWLIANGNTAQAANTLWPVIVKDLAYAVKYWNQTSFDLWEEVNGSSFFTLAATHRALVEGAALATKLSKTCDGCAAAAPQILCFLQKFWTGSYIDSNINVNDGRTGKDVNSIISSIHTFDPASACTNATFQPCSSRALLNHKAVTDSFRTVYGVNKGIAQGKAVAVGRYSEDVYYNGNPWYLATLAAAEQLYAAVYQWNTIGSITVDSVSLPFFKDILPSITTGTYASSSATFKSIVSAVKVYGDGYVAVVQKYTPANGGLAEQFDRSSGSPLSAVDLTWSYAAFLTATDRRSGTVGPSWGEKSNNVPPTTCTAPPSCNVQITFNERVTTAFGDNIFIVGQLTQLGNWDPNSAVALSASKYTSSDPLWYASVSLPASTSFAYKYIKKTSSGTVVWESDPNRSYITGTTCGSTATQNDTWR